MCGMTKKHRNSVIWRPCRVFGEAQGRDFDAPAQILGALALGGLAVAALPSSSRS
jgi:hypothetical protein